MNKILVTGGLGFIGSNLIRHLNARGERDIVLCDHLDSSDKWQNAQGLAITDFIDLSDSAPLLNDIRFDSIIHLGARSDTRERDLKLLYDLNFRASQSLFLAAARQGARFFYASSAATYGDGSAGWSDLLPPAALRPLNPYGFYKNLFDLWATTQADRPPQVCGFKFFNVYGPGENHKGRMASAIRHLIHEALTGSPIRLFKSLRSDIPHGEQQRDFIYIDDAVKVIDYALDHPDIGGLINVGTGHAHSFLDIVQALGRTVGRDLPYEFIDMPDNIAEGYQYYSQAELARWPDATRGFHSLDEGIREYWAVCCRA